MGINPNSGRFAGTRATMARDSIAGESAARERGYAVGQEQNASYALQRDAALRQWAQIALQNRAQNFSQRMARKGLRMDEQAHGLRMEQGRFGLERGRFDMERDATDAERRNEAWDWRRQDREWETGTSPETGRRTLQGGRLVAQGTGRRRLLGSGFSGEPRSPLGGGVRGEDRRYELERRRREEERALIEREESARARGLQTQADYLRDSTMLRQVEEAVGEFAADPFFRAALADVQRENPRLPRWQAMMQAAEASGQPVDPRKFQSGGEALQTEGGSRGAARAGTTGNMTKDQVGAYLGMTARTPGGFKVGELVGEDGGMTTAGTLYADSVNYFLERGLPDADAAYAATGHTLAALLDSAKADLASAERAVEESKGWFGRVDKDLAAEAKRLQGVVSEYEKRLGQVQTVIRKAQGGTKDAGGKSPLGKEQAVETADMQPPDADLKPYWPNMTAAQRQKVADALAKGETTIDELIEELERQAGGKTQAGGKVKKTGKTRDEFVADAAVLFKEFWPRLTDKEKGRIAERLESDDGNAEKIMEELKRRFASRAEPQPQRFRLPMQESFR
jgi:hypothetical protein